MTVYPCNLQSNIPIKLTQRSADIVHVWRLVGPSIENKIQPSYWNTQLWPEMESKTLLWADISLENFANIPPIVWSDYFFSRRIKNDKNILDECKLLEPNQKKVGLSWHWLKSIGIRAIVARYCERNKLPSWWKQDQNEQPSIKPIIITINNKHRLMYSPTWSVFAVFDSRLAWYTVPLSTLEMPPKTTNFFKRLHKKTSYKSEVTYNKQTWQLWSDQAGFEENKGCMFYVRPSPCFS